MCAMWSSFTCSSSGARVGELLERMDEFFSGSVGWPPQVRRVLAFEAEKVYQPEKRYARMEVCHV